MSHVWMSHVAPMNESCHTFKWATHRRNAFNAWHDSHFFFLSGHYSRSICGGFG